MLAHIENTDNKLIDKEYYQKQFLPELAKVIITPLYFRIHILSQAYNWK